MFPKQERDALARTLQDTILQIVPGALEQTVTDGALAYQTADTDGGNIFCLLLIANDHLELRFPLCPVIATTDTRFEEVHGTDACRLVIRERADIPDEILNAALMQAAGIA
jgi:hypothetical protein